MLIGVQPVSSVTAAVVRAVSVMAIVLTAISVFSTLINICAGGGGGGRVRQTFGAKIGSNDNCKCNGQSR